MKKEERYQNLNDYQDQQERVAALQEKLASWLSTELIQHPDLADAMNSYVDGLLRSVAEDQDKQPPPPDSGLAALVGLGQEAATQIGHAQIPPAIEPYHETVTSERVVAVGDLYYIYQHEKIGVFQALLKLQQLFTAGVVKLSSGPGAFGLYQFDRRQVLRHTIRDRQQAYRRVFGYTRARPAPGAKPNQAFHKLLIHFVSQVAQFFRDKRVSDVIRPRTSDPSFGSVAVVRRSGLDLRNNLKDASYGHVNVLRVELLQLLDEAFRILGADDIKNLFGADNAWDVIEAIMKRHLGRPQINASQRSRIALTGRELLHWLAQPYILNTARAQFEALLNQIADEAEEWLTSAEALGIVRPQPRGTVVRKPPVRSREAEWTSESW